MNLPIEDKTGKYSIQLFAKALEPVFTVIPNEHFQGLKKIVLQEKCNKSGFEIAGGFYYSYDDQMDGAYIELYPPVIFAHLPCFIPKSRSLINFGIIEMFLHELGHHQHGYLEDKLAREKEANKFALKWLKRIYGKRLGFYYHLFMIDKPIRKILQNNGARNTQVIL